VEAEARGPGVSSAPRGTLFFLDRLAMRVEDFYHRTRRTASLFRWAASGGRVTSFNYMQVGGLWVHLGTNPGSVIAIA
jgi:hypothetical protein